jgi:hypothetical protein
MLRQEPDGVPIIPLLRERLVQLLQAPAYHPVGITFSMQKLRLRHLRCKEYYDVNTEYAIMTKISWRFTKWPVKHGGVKARLSDTVIHYEGSGVVAGENVSPSGALLFSLALATMAGTTIPFPIAGTHQHVNASSFSSS